MARLVKSRTGMAGEGIQCSESASGGKPTCGDPMGIGDHPIPMQLHFFHTLIEVPAATIFATSVSIHLSNAS